MKPDAAAWPDLTYAGWRDTLATLHLWTQIVGKVRLSLTPWVNHSWQVPLYVTARGLGTSPMPYGSELLEMEFDFISHHLRVRTSRGEERALALEPQTVADFYRQVTDLLGSVAVPVAINELPSELPNPVRFSSDRVHKSYDPARHASLLAGAGADRRYFQALPHGFPWQGEPRALLLGKLRSRSHPVFRTQGPLASGRGPWVA